jgi:hypothetical protein
MLRRMRLTWQGRNLISISSMPPVALELDRFAVETARGRATSQVTTPQLVLGDFDGVRIAAVETRQQIDLAPETSDQEASTLAGWLLDEVQRYRPTGVGFNAVIRLEVEGNDTDPVAQLVQREVAAGRLGIESARYGFKIVYRADSARVTLSIDPDVDDDRAWVASVNRHYNSPPQGDERAAAVEWFAASSHAFEDTIRELVAVSGHEQHAA